MTTNSNYLTRRKFFAATSAVTLASLAPSAAQAAEAATPILQTGNGEWTYRVVPHWGELPTGQTFGGTHGGIATDKAGNLYISTQSSTGILVYSPAGKLLRTIVPQFPEVHSIVHAEEDGVEYFYTTIQHGTPTDNWFFAKLKLDGTVVQRITAPPEAGFKAPNEWRITAAVPAPDGSIVIANGYGDSRIFRFDKHGKYLSAFAGKGKEDGQCDCSHGLTVDTRFDQPLLLVCDRANRRISHFDFDGIFVSHLTQHLRLPCNTSLHGDYALVTELEGRATILDKDGAPVAFLGDNPNRTQWKNYKIDPSDVAPIYFSAAHGAFIDSEANIYISDWNHTGRITKLARVTA